MSTEIFLIAIAISVVVTTITRGSIFKTLRAKNLGFFTKLFNCPYCLAHWVSACFAIVLYDNIIDFVINTFALVGLSSFFTFFLIIYIRWLDDTLHDT